MYNLKNYFFEVLDANGARITSDLCIKLIKNNAAVTTVYGDDIKTAHSYITSGKISTTQFASMAGYISFWYAESSIDVLIMNNKLEGMFISGMTSTGPHHIDWVPGDVRTHVVNFFEDFNDGYVSGDRWTLATDSGGTMTIDDADDGIGSLLSGATDNDGSTITSTDEVFLAQADKNIYFEARVKCTEANTDDANIFVGLADIDTVDLMVDNGAGPAATLDGIGFYKLDGNMYWEFEASNATAKDSNSDMVAYASATWYVLAFEYDYNDGTTAKITPYVNGTAYDAVDLTISGMAEMSAAISVKAGGANAETLKIDYVRVSHERDW